MDRDWLVGGVALVEVIALEHARHGVLRGQTNKVGRRERVHPGGVERHLGLRRVENLEDLLLVGLGVVQHLLTGLWRAGSALAAGVADHAGEVADQEDDLVAQLLELTQLVDQHRVPQVQVGRGWVEARLDAQRLAALELLHQFRLDQYLFRTALDKRQLLFNRLHRQTRNARIQGEPTIQDRPSNTSFATDCDPNGAPQRLCALA